MSARDRVVRAGRRLLTGTVVAAAVAGCGGGGSSHAHTTAALPPLHPSRIGPESMFSPGSELTSDPSGTLNQLQRWGVQRVHVYMLWSSIAPDPQARKRPAFDASDPAAYPAAGWATYDSIVRGLAQRHMAIDLDLGPQAPVWSQGPGNPQPLDDPAWKTNAADYGRWVKAVATRYSGHYTPPGQSSPLPRVDFWSIWNEPNQGQILGPETTHKNSRVEVAPRVYRGMVNAAWSALHQTGHGHDTVLIGELAPLGGGADNPGLFAPMTPMRFLRALYCVDSGYHQLRGAAATARGCPATAAGSARFVAQNPGLFNAAGFAMHPYPQANAPDQPIAGQPDDIVLANIATLESRLDQLQRLYGSHTEFPIWSTEYGYITNPPNPDGAISVKTAALYLNWSEYLTWEHPRIKSYNQFLITDPPGTTVFATGLKFSDGKPKATLRAYVMPLYLPVSSTTKGKPLDVWGQVRPAPDARAQTHKPQTVQIQFRHGPDSRFQTVQRVTLTNPNGYFEVRHTFPSSGDVRLRWTYPDGTTVHSRTAPVALH